MEILLVEDSPADAELTSHALRESRFFNPIHVVQDGQEALDFLFRRGRFAARRPDRAPGLVLLDIKIPRVDGFEVLRQLKADPHTRTVPVVMLTSSDQPRDVAQSYALGANSYIQKPVDFGELRQTVRQIGLYWLRLNHPPPRGAAAP
jgi:CheY-like chemotaxis protein